MSNPLCNQYLEDSLGIKTPVEDSSYVIYNLYVRKLLSHSAVPPRREAAAVAAPLMSSQFGTTMTSTVSAESSVDGKPARTMEQAIVPFIVAVTKMEDLSLHASAERQKRRRFLESFFAAGLPSSAEDLLRGIESLNSTVVQVIGASLPSTQPCNRAARLQVQENVQKTLERLRVARSDVDDALNVMNGLQDDVQEEDDQATGREQEELYEACDALYSKRVLPRAQACEMLLYATSALITRTEEVCHYAWKHLQAAMEIVPDGREDDPDKKNRRVLRGFIQQYVSSKNQRLLQAVPVLLGCYRFRSIASGPGGLSRTTSIEVPDSLRSQVTRLLSLGVEDAVAWVRTAIAKDFAEDEDLSGLLPPSGLNSSVHEAFGRRTNSRFGSTSFGSPSNLRQSSSSSALRQTRSQDRLVEPIEALVETLRVWEGSGSTALLATSRAGEESDVDADSLLDTVGRINIWLRRNGLAVECVASNPDGPKVAPEPIRPAESPFVPHRCADALGWNRDCSALYEEACLSLQLHNERRSVLRRFDELLSLPDAEFFAHCHRSEMLVPLFRAADDSGVVCENRLLVERRLANVMTVRVKLHHYSGDIRVRTFSQKTPLEEVLASFGDCMSDIQSCTLAHFDEGDRVCLSCGDEWTQLIQNARAAALRTTGGGGALGEVKVEIYAERPIPIGVTPQRPRPAIPSKLSEEPRDQELVLRRMQYSSLSQPTEETTPECIPKYPNPPRRIGTEEREHLFNNNDPPRNASGLVQGVPRTKISPTHPVASLHPHLDTPPRRMAQQAISAADPIPHCVGTPDKRAEDMQGIRDELSADVRPSPVKQPSPVRISQWQVPPTKFDFAAHSAQSETVQSTDEEENVMKKHTPSRNDRPQRASEGSELSGSPMNSRPRFSGPLRRKGVPLPPQARK